MKKETHPTYHKDTVITCACGASFPVGSTRNDIHVDVCSACHPFYTGKQKLVDTAGRVDKFKARMEASKKMQEIIAKKEATKKSKAKEESAPESEEETQSK